MLANLALVKKGSFRVLRKMLISDTGIFKKRGGAQVHPWATRDIRMRIPAEGDQQVIPITIRV